MVKMECLKVGPAPRFYIKKHYKVNYKLNDEPNYNLGEDGL